MCVERIDLGCCDESIFSYFFVWSEDVEQSLRSRICRRLKAGLCCFVVNCMNWWYHSNEIASAMLLAQLISNQTFYERIPYRRHIVCRHRRKGLKYRHLQTHKLSTFYRHFIPTNDPKTNAFSIGSKSMYE